MEIKDLQANQGNIDLVGTIVSKDEERTFEKFGKQGRVCNAKMKDDTGEVTLTLWNDEIDQVNVGDKIHIQNGWCSEYRDQKQLSSGKFGKIERVEQAQAEPQPVLTNDPGMLQPQMAEGEALEGEAPMQAGDAAEELDEDDEDDLIAGEEYIG